METITRDFINDLFTSTKGVRDFHHILPGVERSISKDANNELIKPFVKEEVDIAIKGMDPTKAPVADRFPTIFFQ